MIFSCDWCWSSRRLDMLHQLDSSRLVGQVVGGLYNNIHTSFPPWCKHLLISNWLQFYSWQQMTGNAIIITRLTFSLETRNHDMCYAEYFRWIGESRSQFITGKKICSTFISRRRQAADWITFLFDVLESFTVGRFLYCVYIIDHCVIVYHKIHYSFGAVGSWKRWSENWNFLCLFDVVN